MSLEKAKAYFLGEKGHERMNCAQAIIKAFSDRMLSAEPLLREFGSYGAGRAPQGECGSLYAAKFLLKNVSPEKIDQCEEELRHCAGSIRCSDIRALRKVSCLGCVEKVAKYLEEI